MLDIKALHELCTSLNPYCKLINGDVIMNAFKLVLTLVLGAALASTVACGDKAEDTATEEAAAE